MPPVATARRAALLEVEGLAFAAGARRVLDGVSFTVSAGELIAVMGVSGSGKTTLLRCVNRLLEPASGSIRIDGIDVRAIPPVELRRRIGMVAQVPFMFEGTIGENLQRAADYSGASLDDSEAVRLLASVGLDERLDRDASRLSVGQQQRVAMARALVTRPRILLCDEPTASLDAAAASRLESTLIALAGRGVGIVFVTHDAEQARRIAARRLVLEDGRLTERHEGDPAEASA